MKKIKTQGRKEGRTKEPKRVNWRDTLIKK